jgi:hypothetical protein
MSKGEEILNNTTDITPDSSDWCAGDYLTSEQIDEIGAARHDFSYPGIVHIRRHVNEGYVSNGGVHYRGAEEDADTLLEIVDQLYKELELLKAGIDPTKPLRSSDNEPIDF